jgi:hypothetical protein
MKNTLFVCAFFCSLLYSCKDELKPQESFVDYSNINNNTTEQIKTSNILSNSQQNTANTAKTNPPHGQPGHVCGTESQNNTSNNTQPYTINKVVPTTTTSQQPIKVAKGMNPPHGQAGHVCGIAVGAPLSSKPKTTTSQVATTTPSTSSSVPAILNPTTSTAETTKVALGTNPPHGQPGHVCGKAVGATIEDTKKNEEVKTETPKE